MKIKSIIILISGRGSNMEAIVRNIQSGNLKDICKIQYVLSNKVDALGLQIAEGLGIQNHCIPSKGKKSKTYNTLLLDWLKQKDPDYIILAGYMKILSPEIIRGFPKKVINIHPADTTQHQGLHGYDWAFKNKLKTTKITVHYVDEGLDTGDIIGQSTVNLIGCKSLEEVEKRGLKVEHEFYSECLRKTLTTEHTESTENE